MKINIQLFPVVLVICLVLIGGFTLLIKSDNDLPNYIIIYYMIIITHTSFFPFGLFVSQEIQLKLKPHSRFWCITSYNQKATDLYMVLLQKVLLTRNEMVCWNVYIYKVKQKLRRLSYEYLRVIWGKKTMASFVKFSGLQFITHETHFKTCTMRLALYKSSSS